MTVAVEDGLVRLSGRCQAEDAETLLVALQENPAIVIDVTAVQRLHLAVTQILLAAGVPVRGVPENEFLAHHVVNLLQ